MSGPIEGRRILVVGASAGIGLAIGRAAAAAGARVALAARRAEVLDQVTADLTGAVAVVGDTGTEAGATTIVADAVAGLGGLDAAIYVAGISPLGLLDEVGHDQWQEVFAVNLFGAAAIARAAAPHLRAAEPTGRLVFISSNAPERPWPGMVVYAASKAALDTFVVGWNHEHHDIGATRVVVGPTATTMALGWDPELGGRLRERWAAEGYLPTDPMVQQPDDVARAVVEVLATPTRITDVRVVPPGV